MARVNSAEMPGSMAILGLVIEEPGMTVSHVAQRLDERFPRARFAGSTAHSALPQMARQGSQPPRVERTYRANGNARHLDRYEATLSGRDAFRSWMLELPTGAPVLREAMFGRVELCELEDVPRLIAMAREEAAIATALYSDASGRLTVHSTARKEPKDHLRVVREVLLYVEPMHWSSRAERYDLLADRLEEIAKEAGLLPEA